jgi:hypothetical protein
MKTAYFAIAVFAMIGILVPSLSQTAIAANTEKCTLHKGQYWLCNTTPEEGKLVNFAVTGYDGKTYKDNCEPEAKLFNVSPDSSKSGTMSVESYCWGGILFWTNFPYKVAGNN